MTPPLMPPMTPAVTPPGRLHYGWKVVASSMVILATHSLTFFSFGIFLKPVTTQFGWERGAFSLAISITMIVSGSLSVLAGRLSDRHGPRLLVTISGLLTGTGFLLMSQISELWHVYLIYGGLIAVGGSGCVIPITSTIPRWFATKRGTALGLTWTGMAIGGMIGPLLAQSLISGHGWRLAYVALGLANLTLIPLLAQTLRRDPQQIGSRPYGESQAEQDGMPAGMLKGSLSLRQAVRTPRYWFLASLLPCIFFIHQVMMAHLAPHAIDAGMAPTMAATVISILGAANLIGRNLAGFASDRIGARSYLSICVMVVALAFVWLLFARDLWMLYLFAVVYGVAQGGVPIAHTLIIGDLFGLEYLGAIMATTMVMGSMGGAIGAPLAGSIYDGGGSYQSAFIICLGLGTLALILSLFLLRARPDN